jgi:hypothetical protein
VARFPGNLTLEAEVQAFYAALGKAMAQWQPVESALAIIFTAIVSGDINRQSLGNATFHALASFKPKLEMLDAAMAAASVIFPLERSPWADKSIFSEWNALRNRTSKRADRRNEIAHFAMHIEPMNPPGRRCFLAPNVMNVNSIIKYEGTPPTRNICMIMAIGNSFENLANDLQEFYSKWVAQEVWPFATSM